MTDRPEPEVAALPGHRGLVVAALVLGAVLRLLSLGDYPLAVGPDELSNLVDGWSLATTGADRFGAELPTVLRGPGEGERRPALQAWLCAAPQALTGFSVAAGRLPSALLGIVTLALLFLVVRDLAGRTAALFALVFAALSPWHLLYSRMAHQDAALPAFFVLLVLFLWHAAAESGFPPAGVAVLGLAVGLSANAGQPAFLASTVVGAGALAHLLATAGRRGRWRPLAAAAVVFTAAVVVGALPQVVVSTRSPAGLLGLAPGGVLPHAGLLDLARQTVRGLAVNLDPRHLFFSFGTVNNLSVGRALPIEAVLFYPGLLLGWLAVPRKAIPLLAAAYLALFAGLLPAALTDPVPNALRASAASVLVPAFSALGAAALGAVLTRLVAGMLVAGRSAVPRAGSGQSSPATRLLGGAYAALVLLLALALGAAGVARYAHSEELRDAGQQHLLVRTAERLGELAPAYEAVVFEPFGAMTCLYLAAFGGMTPAELRATGAGPAAGDTDDCRPFPRYHFTDVATGVREWERAGRPRTLVVTPHGRPAAARSVAEVEFGGRRVYFYEMTSLPVTPPDGVVPLSSLAPARIDCPFAPPQMDRSFNGDPLVLDGIRYEHGIGMHAPCALSWRVPAGATGLHAVVGVAEQARGCGRGDVVFEVYDQAGRPLYSSGILTSADGARPLDVPLRGVDAVTLAVLEGRRGRDCDHADWADAAFVR
ncbi:MAG: NPCBM/NEW2 domain-containing protein [Acidobacteria bacterium]|nr:NPCBM/NEW2 domain-containing protein [Acidobacteriota bacterium]